MHQDATLATEVGLGPGDIVLYGAHLPPQKRAQHPHFLAHVYCGQTVARLSNCCALVIVMLLWTFFSEINFMMMINGHRLGEVTSFCRYRDDMIAC